MTQILINGMWQMLDILNENTENKTFLYLTGIHKIYPSGSQNSK